LLKMAIQLFCNRNERQTVGRLQNRQSTSDMWFNRQPLRSLLEARGCADGWHVPEYSKGVESPKDRSISGVSYQLAMVEKRKLEAYATYGIGQFSIDQS